MKLSEHFTLEELQHSDTAVARKIINEAGKEEVENLKKLCEFVLEPVRALIGRPMMITSGYRGPALEKVVSGVTNPKYSQHMSGLAADFQVNGMRPRDIFTAIIANGDNIQYDQLIIETNRSKVEWIHISYGTRKENLVATDVDEDGKMEYKRYTKTA